MKTKQRRGQKNSIKEGSLSAALALDASEEQITRLLKASKQDPMFKTATMTGAREKKSSPEVHDMTVDDTSQGTISSGDKVEAQRPVLARKESRVPAQSLGESSTSRQPTWRPKESWEELQLKLKELQLKKDKDAERGKASNSAGTSKEHRKENQEYELDGRYLKMPADEA